MLSWCTRLYFCAIKTNKLQVFGFFSSRIVILTVSIGVFSKGRVTPPGVRVGLKETERFPDTGVAVGTTSLCTGGSVASIWMKKAGKLQINRIHNQTAATQIKGRTSDVKMCTVHAHRVGGLSPTPITSRHDLQLQRDTEGSDQKLQLTWEACSLMPTTALQHQFLPCDIDLI